MAKPTEKSPEMEAFLEQTSGRTTAIEGQYCVKVPIGCGKRADEFEDDLSRKEYRISGLCQNCQNAIFGGGA